MPPRFGGLGGDGKPGQARERARRCRRGTGGGSRAMSCEVLALDRGFGREVGPEVGGEIGEHGFAPARRGRRASCARRRRERCCRAGRGPPSRISRMPVCCTQPKSEQLGRAPGAELVRSLAKAARQRRLPARPVRAGRIGDRREMAGEDRSRPSQPVRRPSRNRLLDLGARAVEGLLRRIAAVRPGSRTAAAPAAARAAMGRRRWSACAVSGGASGGGGSADAVARRPASAPRARSAAAAPPRSR